MYTPYTIIRSGKKLRIYNTSAVIRRRLNFTILWFNPSDILILSLYSGEVVYGLLPPPYSQSTIVCC